MKKKDRIQGDLEERSMEDRKDKLDTFASELHCFAPVHDGLALLGEPSKFVAASPARFDQLAIDPTAGLSVRVHGAAGEVVTVAVLVTGKPQHHTVTIPAAGHVQVVVRPRTPPVAATGRRDTPTASSPAAPSSLPRAGAWIASDGKDWEVCQRMQPLHQPCNLPNQTMFSTHFFCDVQLMEAEWNRSKTPGILDIYSCRPEKIWMNTNMKLAPGPPTGQHNPHNLSGLTDGWEPRLRGWLADAEPLLLAGKIQGV